MVIRPVRREDLHVIDAIYRQGHDDHFSLPSLEDTITSAVAEDGPIIGFGLVKVYAECVAVLDYAQSKGKRLEALHLLLQEAFRACEERGIEQLHAYVQEPGMKRILIKRFGFDYATGVALVKEIERG